VLKYAEREELKDLLLNVFAEGERYRESQAAAEEFVEKNSAENIARQFLILTFSVVTVGVLPLKQQPGDFAASCHDKRSH